MSTPQAQQPTPDQRMGMKWWNGMTEMERRWVFSQVDQIIPGMTASISDAWALWKAGKISMTLGRTVAA